MVTLGTRLNNVVKEYKNDEFFPLNNACREVAELNDTAHGCKARLANFKVIGHLVAQLVGSAAIKLPVQAGLVLGGLVVVPAVNLANRIVCINNLEKEKIGLNSKAGKAKLNRLDNQTSGVKRKLAQVLSKIAKAFPSITTVVSTIIKIVKLAIATLLSPIGFIAPRAMLHILHKLSLITDAKLAKKDRKARVISEAKLREGSTLRRQRKNNLHLKIEKRTSEIVREKLSGKREVKFVEDTDDWETELGYRVDTQITGESILKDAYTAALEKKRDKSFKKLAKKQHPREVTADEKAAIAAKYFAPASFKELERKKSENNYETDVGRQKNKKYEEEYNKWNLTEEEVESLLNKLGKKYNNPNNKVSKEVRAEIRALVKAEEADAREEVVSREMRAVAIDSGVRVGDYKEDYEAVVDLAEERSFAMPVRHYYNLFEITMRQFSRQKLPVETEDVETYVDAYGLTRQKPSHAVQQIEELGGDLNGKAIRKTRKQAADEFWAAHTVVSRAITLKRTVNGIEEEVPAHEYVSLKPKDIRTSKTDTAKYEKPVLNHIPEDFEIDPSLHTLNTFSSDAQRAIYNRRWRNARVKFDENGKGMVEFRGHKRVVDTDADGHEFVETKERRSLDNGAPKVFRLPKTLVHKIYKTNDQEGEDFRFLTTPSKVTETFEQLDARIAHQKRVFKQAAYLARRSNYRLQQTYLGQGGVEDQVVLDDDRFHRENYAAQILHEGLENGIDTELKFQQLNNDPAALRARLAVLEAKAEQDLLVQAVQDLFAQAEQD